MNRRFLVFLAGAFALAGALAWAQRDVNGPPVGERFELRSLFPLETSPGVYRQVNQVELDTLANQGWELVSVAPFVVRNEERGQATPRPVVTQFYPAYFFRRPYRR